MGVEVFTSILKVRRFVFGGALRRGLWKVRFRNPHIPVDTDRIRRVLFPFALKRVGL